MEYKINLIDMDRAEEILREQLKIDKAVGFGKLMWELHKSTIKKCMQIYVEEQLRIGVVRISLPSDKEIEKKAEFRQRPRKVDNDPKEEFILGFMQGADWIKELATRNES